MAEFTHLSAAGEANMVDVSAKAQTSREAHAQAVVKLNAATLQALQDQRQPKGDVLACARIAGIQAAKQTSQLIPLCHPLMLSKVQVNFELEPEDHQVRVLSMAKLCGQTGVEMEALTAASVAALTIYDMCKAVQKDIEITEVKLLSKTGGKSGDYHLVEDGEGGA